MQDEKLIDDTYSLPEDKGRELAYLAVSGMLFGAIHTSLVIGLINGQLTPGLNLMFVAGVLLSISVCIELGFSINRFFNS